MVSLKEVRDLRVDGPEGERRVLLREPAGAMRGAPRPAIVLLHGAGATASMALGNTGWRETADRDGVLLVCPEGTRPDPASPPRFLQNPQAWNDGSGRGHTARAGVDDVGFLRKVLDTLVDRHDVDPDRIYLAGFSNGASMTFRAGAELHDRFAAIGPVSGHCWVSPPAPAASPLPALMIYGGLDPLNPVAGGDVKTPWGATEYHPPVLESFDRWGVFSGCEGAPARPNAMEGVREFRSTGCPAGADVRCLIVEDLGHHWPGAPRSLPPWIAGPASTRLSGASTLWEFFRGHRRG